MRCFLQENQSQAGEAGAQANSKQLPGGAAYLSSPYLAMKLLLLSAACPSPDSACFTAGAACLLLQRNGQGNDHGSQYRTGIYWHNEDQRQVSYLLTMKVTATVPTHTMCGQPGLLLPSQLA